ncbi:hypothetical protein D9758_002759 [Tetrapyrgos nigripes]|uniref:Nibrin second BRCT domain-containing protein n=1 Tax=Tetrapyrgos nigripes TaxID=182062 RepID=A0A8H5LTZ6_9AGAR|nr:hypothetical protein D9758_002759 [Tetrapyrgos nigripes]
MWVLSGPFDGSAIEESKPKYVKAGLYGLGRKNQPLLIESKKISSHQATFRVGKYSKDDVMNPSARPKIEVNSLATRGVTYYERAGDRTKLEGDEFVELQENDIVGFPLGYQVVVKWHSICCFLSTSRSSTVPVDTCSILGKASQSSPTQPNLMQLSGINVVHNPGPEVTVHLSSTYTLSTPMAASLTACCQFAQPEWLDKVKQQFEGEAKTLEALPSLEKFKPTFTPSLPKEHQVHEFWSPNEKRRDLFKGHRFICVVDSTGKRTMDPALRETLERGGGAIETFSVHDGKPKFRDALNRGRAKNVGTLVFVADPVAMEAANQENWALLVEVAKDFDLHVVTPNDIIKCVLKVDISVLAPKPSLAGDEQPARAASPLPSFVPNTIADEPSVPPPEKPVEAPGPGPEPAPAPARRRPLRRRDTSTSTPASQEPAVEAPPPPQPQTQEPQIAEEAPRRRRHLTRRTNPDGGELIVTGYEDNSMVMNAIENAGLVKPEPSEPSRPITDLTKPSTTTRRFPRMKRRIGTLEESPAPVDPTEEPPSKKFKALFEASDPDKAGDMFTNTVSLLESVTQSQTQSGVGASSSSVAVAMELIEEEPDESNQTMGSAQTAAARGTKRKASGSEDQEMADVEENTRTRSRAGSVRPASKKAAIENVNAVERTHSTDPAAAKPSSTTAAAASSSTKPSSSKLKTNNNSGAAPGKPDTDEAFLKAVASTKRGKKNEDNFDREFNKLKISKPELDRGVVDEEEQWGVLEEFGDETNIRGNFMVVVELPVHKDHNPLNGKKEINPDWQDLPNFKKFKKKDARRTSRTIELVVSEENDDFIIRSKFRSGKGKDKGKKANEARFSSPEPEADQSGNSQASAFQGFDSDKEERSKRGNSRAGSAQPTRGAARKPAKTMALFIEDDEDESQMKSEVLDSDLDEVTQTLKSTAPPTKRPTGRTGRKPAVIDIDDDSDDDFTFKGFKGRARR